MASTTPYIDRIERFGRTVTASYYVQKHCPSYHSAIPRGEEPLFSDRFAPAEVRQTMNDYLTAGAIEGNWKKASKFYTDDIVYISNNTGGDPWIGRKMCRKKLLFQTSLVPGGRYDVFDQYWQSGNIAGWYEWNIFTSKSGKKFEVPNYSFVVYSGGGLIRFACDLYDMGRFLTVLLEYFEDDLLAGGTAALHFIKAAALGTIDSGTKTIIVAIEALFTKYGRHLDI